jgi:hypothetical protein
MNDLSSSPLMKNFGLGFTSSRTILKLMEFEVLEEPSYEKNLISTKLATKQQNIS